MKILRIQFCTLTLLTFCTVAQLFSKVEFVQRRFVPQENIEEFIRRETTYWSEVARKAIDEGKLEEWSLWQRVDGLNMDFDHNFMFVNLYTQNSDIDHMEEIWDAQKVFPNVAMEAMETMSLSTVKDLLFYEQVAFSSKADPKYVRINYAKAENIQDYIDVELEEWFPFVQERMDSGKTNVVSWELSRIVAPRGRDIRHEAVSVDGFETLSAALFTVYGTDVPFPDMGRLFAVHHKAEVHVYKLIMAVHKD